MKTKILAMIMLCMMAMSLMGGVPVSAATNLLTTNVSFESPSATGWSKWTTTEWDIEVTSSMARSGAQSLRAEAIADETAANLTLTYTGCPALTTGQYYVFSAWVNIPVWKEKTASGFKLRISQTAAPKETYSENFATTTENGWKKVSLTFYASSTNPQLRLLLGAGVEKGSVIYVDDISLMSLKEYYDEKYTNAFCNVEEYGIANNGVVATQAMDEISKWPAVNTTYTTKLDQTVKTEGSGSMCIETGEAGANTYVQWGSGRPSLPAVTDYEVSAWIYIPREYEDKVTSVQLYAEALRTTGYLSATTPAITETGGAWKRISCIITPDAARVGQMKVVRFSFITTGVAKIYIDKLQIVEKKVQYPTLQFLKPVKNTAGNDVLLDTKTIGGGAFSLCYDEHVVNPDSVGNTLIAAIYKTETDGTKRLVEVKLDTFAASEKELTLSFDGLETPDNTYSLEVMLWDNMTQTLTGIKHGTYKLTETLY